MRGWSFLFIPAMATLAQAQVRINELMCTRPARQEPAATAGDWVELYNAGNKAVDLSGYALVLKGQVHYLAQGRTIGARQYKVLWCDGAVGQGPDHVGFKLPRSGGTLLLVASDRTTVVDLFHWPALPPGVSTGAAKDGSRDRGFFTVPTPGLPNQGGCSSVLPVPQVAVPGGAVVLSNGGVSPMRYTLDGSVPDEGSAPYQGPLELPPGTVLTARSMARGTVPSPCTVFTVGMADSTWALAACPADLFGGAGIMDVPSGNYARKGREWERPAWLQRAGAAMPVGLTVAGSGSRSLPKRNFRLLAKDRFGSPAGLDLPGGTSWQQVILRADATPMAFLRNVFMEEVARQCGNRVDVQPSSPIHLFLNGQDQGLYRAMPAKGREWAQHLNIGRPVDLVEGPGMRAVSGSAKPYRRMLEALMDGQTKDSLERLLEINSLVELACFDLWTGRADHELNVRSWRPRDPGGRWRWILFDMDQWAPPREQTVQRMCSGTVPEAPFLPQLLADPGLQGQLLARLTAMLASALEPVRATRTADSLLARYHHALTMDHALWKDRMEVPTPEAAQADLLDHINGRNAPLLQQLSRRTGLALRDLEVQVQPPGAGRVMAEGLMLAGPRCLMRVFNGVPLELQAIPAPGMEFAGWRGAEGNGDRVSVGALRDTRVTAIFRPVGLSRQGRLQQGPE